MPKEDHIKLDGVVVKEERTHFVVKLDNGHLVNCTLKGNMKRHFIRVLADDRVQIEVCPYDLSKGFISYRYKN